MAFMAAIAPGIAGYQWPLFGIKAQGSFGVPVMGEFDLHDLPV